MHDVEAGPDGDGQMRPGAQLVFWIFPLGPDAPKKYETDSDATVEQVLDRLGLGGDYNLTTITELPVMPGLHYTNWRHASDSDGWEKF